MSTCEQRDRSPLVQLTETKEREGKERDSEVIFPVQCSLVHKLLQSLVDSSCVLLFLCRDWIKPLILMIYFEIERMRLIKLYAFYTRICAYMYVCIYIYICVCVYRRRHGRNYRHCTCLCSAERDDDDDVGKKRTNTIRQANRRVGLSLVNLGLLSHCLHACICLYVRTMLLEFCPVLAREQVEERKKKREGAFFRSVFVSSVARCVTLQYERACRLSLTTSCSCTALG